MPSARAAADRHRLLVAVVAAYLVGLTVYGLGNGARLTVPYAVLVIGGAFLVARLEPPGGFSGVVWPLADTNVGGYHNTGRDLIANMAGSAVAAAIAARRAPAPA